MSAYEAANDGFGDEGYAPSGGSAWFGGEPGMPGDGAASGYEFGAAAKYSAAVSDGSAEFGSAKGDADFGSAIGAAFANAGFGEPTGQAGYSASGANGYDGTGPTAGHSFGAANGAGTDRPGYPASGANGFDDAGPGFRTTDHTGYPASSANGFDSAAPTARPDYRGITPAHHTVAYATQPAYPRPDFSAPPVPRTADPTSSSALLPAVAHPGPPRPAPAGPDVLRLVAVTAGLGQPSTARILADRLADAARARVGARGRQVIVEVLELRDLALDIAGAMVAGFPGAKLRAALDAVEGADGLIAVSPIYTASYSGLFKSFFDVLDKDALTGKPTLIAATGGTARHSLALDHALRPMFAYLRAFIVPTAVFAASEDWASAGENALNERVERAGGELGDLMVGQSGAAAAAGAVGTPAPATAHRRRDEFEDVTPFEQRMAMLRSGL